MAIFFPTHTITRTLALVEQLIGVFYPAILIGRLVSLTVGKQQYQSRRKGIKNIRTS